MINIEIITNPIHRENMAAEVIRHKTVQPFPEEEDDEELETLEDQLDSV